MILTSSETQADRIVLASNFYDPGTISTLVLSSATLTSVVTATSDSVESTAIELSSSSIPGFRASVSVPSQSLTAFLLRSTLVTTSSKAILDRLNYLIVRMIQPP